MINISKGFWKSHFIILTLLLFMSALSNANPAGEESDEISLLINQLSDKDPSVRIDAVKTLGENGDSRAVEPLIKLLNDKHDLVFAEAVTSLELIRDRRAVDPLIEMLNHRRMTRRYAALLALPAFKDEKAVIPLIKALKDEKETVEFAAMWALAKMGSLAVSAMIDALKEKELCLGISISIETMSEPPLELLNKALKHGDKSVRICSSMILARIGDKSAKVSDDFYTVDDISSDEYGVYSALFKYYLKTRGHIPLFWDQPETIVVEQQTSKRKKLDSDSVISFERTMKRGTFPVLPSPLKVKLDADLIEDFNRKNEKSHRLEDNFSGPPKVMLLSGEEADEIFKVGGWDEFNKRYPGTGGIIEVSRVGFNSARSRAFLYISGRSGWETGADYHVLLVRPWIDGDWRVIKEVRTFFVINR